jgi:hypothetical protein
VAIVAIVKHNRDRAKRNVQLIAKCVMTEAVASAIAWSLPRPGFGLH